MSLNLSLLLRDIVPVCVNEDSNRYCILGALPVVKLLKLKIYLKLISSSVVGFTWFVTVCWWVKYIALLTLMLVINLKFSR